jgi:hypothetical protein
MAMEEICYRFAGQSSEQDLRGLLAESALPHEDIAPYLTNFILAIERGCVIGAIGLEHYGRSPSLLPAGGGGSAPV